jgi:RNA polymerase subunit RPABC4/transcription elongation factor Spt4
MKPKHVGGMIFGIIMMVVAIMAFFSGEPASQTQTGCCGIAVVFLLGIGMFVENIIEGAKDKNQTNIQSATSPMPATVQTIQPSQNTSQNTQIQAGAIPSSQLQTQIQTTQSQITICPRCRRTVSADYMICPYCGYTLKPTCPNCGKSVQADFAFCPFCKSQLPQINNQGMNMVQNSPQNMPMQSYVPQGQMPQNTQQQNQYSQQIK